MSTCVEELDVAEPHAVARMATVTVVMDGNANLRCDAIDIEVCLIGQQRSERPLHLTRLPVRAVPSRRPGRASGQRRVPEVRRLHAGQRGPELPDPGAEGKTNFNGTGVDPNSPFVEKVNQVCGKQIVRAILVDQRHGSGGRHHRAGWAASSVLKPSRTISWSSAMRQVMVTGALPPSYRHRRPRAIAAPLRAAYLAAASTLLRGSHPYRSVRR